MNEIIERVAQAIALWDGSSWEGAIGGREAVRDRYRNMARAAITAMSEPTVEMVAAAFPCEKDEKFSHKDKQLGAAVCLKLGGGADIGLLEGEAVKQAAFLARDYRLMIAAATRS
jgi:hypothetical protein